MGASRGVRWCELRGRRGYASIPALSELEVFVAWLARGGLARKGESLDAAVARARARLGDHDVNVVQIEIVGTQVSEKPVEGVGRGFLGLLQRECLPECLGKRVRKLRGRV